MKKARDIAGLHEKRSKACVSVHDSALFPLNCQPIGNQVAIERSYTLLHMIWPY